MLSHGTLCQARAITLFGALLLTSALSACKDEPPGGSYCGDGILDPTTEECDGDQVGQRTCPDYGFAGGQLRCFPNCRIDTVECNDCGNGVIDTGEECEGADLQGATCESLGHIAGTLTCVSCRLDPSGCRPAVQCGDGFVDGDEACDDGNHESWDGCNECAVVEFRLHDDPDGRQTHPDLTVLPDDHTVAVWSDGGDAIVGRWIPPSGPLGAERVLVPGYEADFSSGLEIVSNASGDFVVVWSRRYGTPTHYEIVAQRFNASGASTGAIFRINEGAVTFCPGPSAALDDSGNLFVAWSSIIADDGDVHGRAFTANDTPFGPDFVINQYTGATSLDQQIAPSVAVDSSGEVVVVWHSDNNDYWSWTHNGIWARRYLSSGLAVGDEFAISEAQDHSDRRWPSVARHPNGQYVVAWAHEVAESAYYHVVAQSFSGTSSTGSVVQVTEASGGSVSPDVAMGADGRWLVTWRHSMFTDKNVWVRPFSAAGVPLSGAIRTHVHEGDEHFLPDVGVTSTGAFVVVWESEEQDPGDVNTETGIYGQRFSADGVPLGLVTAP